MAKLLRSLLVLVALVASGCGLAAQGPASGARTTAPLARSSETIGPLDMVDARNGWALSGDRLEHTTDGAQTLHIVTPRGVTRIDGFYFFDARQAWVISSSTLEYTSDGGAHWRAIPMHPALSGDPVFVDADHGWLETSISVDNHTAVDQTLWRTVDGGVNWQRVNESTYKIDIEPNVQKGDCSRSFPVWTSDTHGVAGIDCPGDVSPKVQVTDDGGRSWSSVGLPPLPALPGISLFAGVGPIQIDRQGVLVTMVSRCIGSDGMSCRNYGELYRSSDRGLSWTASSVVWGAGQVLAADAEHVWIPDACPTDQCSQPFLLITADGGRTWKAVGLPKQLWPNMHGSRIYSLADPMDAFVVVANEFDPETRYFRTTDGGLTFSQFSPRIVA